MMLTFPESIQRFLRRQSLKREQCDRCGGALPLVRPDTAYRACSMECADELQDRYVI